MKSAALNNNDHRDQKGKRKFEDRNDLHQVLMMNLVRVRRCGNVHCLAEPRSIDMRTMFTRSVYQVHANILCELVKHIQSKRLSKSFGQLLHLASISQNEFDREICPMKSCGYQQRTALVLTNHPDLVSIAIDWNGFQCSTAEVEDLLSSIDPLIHLHELFYDVISTDARQQQLHLIGLVCFYAGTIEVFFSYDHQTCQWHFYFDGNVLISSDWNAVQRKCLDFHLQPFLLIYANPSRNPCDISQLLKQTVTQAKEKLPGTERRSNPSTTLPQPSKASHSIDHLQKISSFAHLNSSMLFLPQSSYINQETVAKVMQQQFFKRETLSDTTSISSSSNSSPIVHVRHRSQLIQEDTSSNGDASSSSSSSSSQRDSGVSSGVSDGSPRDSLTEHEQTLMDHLIKQTEMIRTDDPIDRLSTLVEEEFQASLKSECVNDYSSAIACCERALNHLESILQFTHPTDQGTSIYARTKKNSLLLRIRSLRQREDEQQQQQPHQRIRSSFTSTFKPTDKPMKKSEAIYDNNLSQTKTSSSILSSHSKVSRPKKNVKFSDHVALIVPRSDDTDEPPSEHLIHSFLRQIQQQKQAVPSSTLSSDSDSDTPSTSSNEIPIGLTECTLCHKRCLKTNLIGNYCSNCHFYMQRFQPSTTST